MKVLSQSELDAILSDVCDVNSYETKSPEFYRYYFFLKCNPNIKKEDYSYYDNCIAYFFEKLNKYNGSYDYKKKDDEKYKLGLKCVKYISQKGSEVLDW